MIPDQSPARRRLAPTDSFEYCNEARTTGEAIWGVAARPTRQIRAQLAASAALGFSRVAAQLRAAG